MAALPFCQITLKGKKPCKSRYPEKLLTLGDHIRKRRLDLGLTVTHVANILRTSISTVQNWEMNRAQPSIWFLPAIYRFIDYAPENGRHKTFGEKVKSYRESRGLSQAQFAWQIGIDPETLRSIEKGGRKTTKGILDKIERIIGAYHAYSR